MTDNFKKIFLLLSTLPMFVGCSAIGDIFKAGMSVGIFAVIAVVVVVVFIISRFTRRE